MATVLADDLVVRSAPSTGSGSKILTPHLGRGDRLFVIAGPTTGSGYRWYLVDPLAHDAVTRAPLGWVAAASREGEPWIEGIVLACPSLPDTLATLASMEDAEWLACFGGATLTVTASHIGVLMPGCPECHGEPDWLNSAAPGRFFLDASHDYGIDVAFAQGVPPWDYPFGNRRYLVTGHFDDPAAASCRMTFPDPLTGEEREVPAAVQHFSCRLTFVVTAYEQVGGS